MAENAKKIAVERGKRLKVVYIDRRRVAAGWRAAVELETDGDYLTGREAVLAMRQEFEALHGPQKWKVAL